MPNNFFVHESSYVDDGVVIGAGTKIWHFCHIMSEAQIGETCNIGQNVFVGSRVKIGNNVKIQNNVSVYEGVILKDGVFCGPSVVFTNIYNPRAEINKMGQVLPTLIKQGASLGANCTIVCGVTVGEYAFIGAGAVVNKSVMNHALMVGNPIRQIGWVCRCGERLYAIVGTEEFSCLSCNNVYVKNNDGLENY